MHCLLCVVIVCETLLTHRRAASEMAKKNQQHLWNELKYTYCNYIVSYLAAVEDTVFKMLGTAITDEMFCRRMKYIK